MSTVHVQRRLLSKRASAVLSALDIHQTEWPLPGVYDGRWGGSGEVFESVCPATGEVLARVQGVSVLDSQLSCMMVRCVDPM